MSKKQDAINLATRVAWLHYMGGHTQAAIAEILNISNIRIHRPLNLARSEKIVTFSVHGL